MLALKKVPGAACRAVLLPTQRGSDRTGFTKHSERFGPALGSDYQGFVFRFAGAQTNLHALIDLGARPIALTLSLDNTGL